ncbi:MAG TPA: single-stranded-DNA-specific exonuclease RecJ [Nevskiales bacterium]|nr:single-stranded-DNA-specific exonuclease RecJ [Nevskiales bacterium]
MMRRRIQRRSPQAADELPAGLHPVLRRVYLNRGIGTAADTDLSLSRLLPFHTLKGIDQAVELLCEALRRQWHVCVIGDYDADGATSTALVVSLLRQFGLAQVSYLVPDRFRYGYGLTPEIVALARLRRPDLLITVDNGIASVEGVAAARAAGMRVLITDHHLPGKVLPQADAIVNPNQPGCDFPSKALAGVGVAFYLMSALRARLRADGQGQGPSLVGWLDLVALGTVADVVSLDHNNRILVEQGLRRLRAGRARPGIQALLRVAGRDVTLATSSDLGYAVAPRLNAAGRLDDMGIGIECLLSDDEDRALQQARRLDQLNRERRALQQQMQEGALADLAGQLDAGELPVGLCVYDPQWHQGVTGPVAGRLKEHYHRPVVAFAPAEPGLLKGSGRSVAGFHLRDALDAIATRNPGLITKFGGHAMAAGLSLETARLDEFRHAFDREARRWLDASALDGVIESDGELAPAEISLALAEALLGAGPWGQGFPEPLFDGAFEVLERRIVGERHLKLHLRPLAGGAPLAGIAFGSVAGAEPGQRIRAAYRLGINDYAGRRCVEAVVEYFEPEQPGAV